jgi:hypothetical protein
MAGRETVGGLFIFDGRRSEMCGFWGLSPGCEGACEVRLPNAVDHLRTRPMVHDISVHTKPVDDCWFARTHACSVLRLKGGKFSKIKQAKMEWRKNLWQCAREGKVAALKHLIKQPLDSIDVADGNKGWNALTWAAAGNHAKCVQTLIEAGANVNAQDKKGATALHWAAALDNREVLSVLARNGANLSKLDEVRSLHVGNITFIVV